jgi:hypothetical protein
MVINFVGCNDWGLLQRPPYGAENATHSTAQPVLRSAKQTGGSEIALRNIQLLITKHRGLVLRENDSRRIIPMDLVFTKRA